MYSEEDINSAVEAGALSEDAAASFRAHMSEVRGISRGDEENFRLLNSFNDIFVAIGIAIMLFAAGAIGQQLGKMLVPPPDWNWDANLTDAQFAALSRQQSFSTAVSVAIAAGLVAVTSWPLAEFFTRARRMALPSIILLLGFVGGIFVGSAALGVSLIGTEQSEPLAGYFIAGAGVIAALAAWLHWARFKVPITVAAGAAALSATLIGLILSAVEPLDIDAQDVMLWLTLVAGLLVFAFAMRWDLSDPERTTRRSDVAFWLHLLAAPMIAHPIFYTLGVVGGSDIGLAKAISVLAIYVAFGIVALIVDRRALLVSALVYVLFALAFLFDRFGAVELTVALTALVIGSALLTLSAFWAPIRRGVLGIVPEDWRDALPSSERELVAA
ncbi:hypothetical protein [Citromicrobium bathyomarinum]|uniref:hypothetical protein n=1 Tax=Citromicrobium bathyomarinum TaxID=72174 RepID=UPI00315A994B